MGKEVKCIEVTDGREAWEKYCTGILSRQGDVNALGYFNDRELMEKYVHFVVDDLSKRNNVTPVIIGLDTTHSKTVDDGVCAKGAADTIVYIAQVCKSRYELLVESKAVNIAAYNKENVKELSTVVCLVLDFDTLCQQLTVHEHADVVKAASCIGKVGRTVGIHFVFLMNSNAERTSRVVEDICSLHFRVRSNNTNLLGTM